MFKLIGQLLIISIFVILVNHIIRSVAINDKTWGNPTVDVKNDFYKKKISDINTVFIGASTTYKQLIPAIFDRKVYNTAIKSFNFGSQSTMPPETFRIYKNILNMKGEQIKYAFIDLSMIDPCSDDNLHTVRKQYWYTPGTYWFAVNALFNSAYDDEYKKSAIKNHTISFIEKFFNVGFVINKIEYVKRKQNMDEEEIAGILGDHKDGFVGLYTDAPVLIKRRNAFLRDTSRIIWKKEKIGRLFDQDASTQEVNQVYLDKVNELIEFSKKRDIQLIFFLQARMSLDFYRNILPVFNAIDDKHKIDMADPNKYPEFYQVQYLFDGGHMNPEGAMIYSRIFARKFDEILRTPRYNRSNKNNS